jgi:hypothetical protein
MGSSQYPAMGGWNAIAKSSASNPDGYLKSHSLTLAEADWRDTVSVGLRSDEFPVLAGFNIAKYC